MVVAFLVGECWMKYVMMAATGYSYVDVNIKWKVYKGE